MFHFRQHAVTSLRILCLFAANLLEVVMTRRLIPDGDRAFAAFARFFVDRIAEEPARFRVSSDSIERAATLVHRVREALAVHLRPATSTVFTRRIKDDARRQAVSEIRRLGRIIRADDRVSANDKAILNIRQANGKGRKRELPAAPPCLQFLGPARDPRKHLLLCTASFGTAHRCKPRGAVRAELFVGFVKPDDASRVLGSPYAQASALAPALYYVRSFTTSWIEVEFPIPTGGEPMLLVYWARWANAVGEVGPWSKPAAARVECAAALPQSRIALPELPMGITAFRADRQLMLAGGSVERGAQGRRRTSSRWE
jgi:hypothetical protein